MLDITGYIWERVKSIYGYQVTHHVKKGNVMVVMMDLD